MPSESSLLLQKRNIYVNSPLEPHCSFFLASFSDPFPHMRSCTKVLTIVFFAFSPEPSLSEGTFSPSFVLSLGKGESELSLFVRVWILTGGVAPLGGTHSLFSLCNRCWTRSPGLMLIISIKKSITHTLSQVHRLG